MKTYNNERIAFCPSCSARTLHLFKDGHGFCQNCGAVFLPNNRGKKLYTESTMSRKCKLISMIAHNHAWEVLDRQPGISFKTAHGHVITAYHGRIAKTDEEGRAVKLTVNDVTILNALFTIISREPFAEEILGYKPKEIVYGVYSTGDDSLLYKSTSYEDVNEWQDEHRGTHVTYIARISAKAEEI